MNENSISKKIQKILAKEKLYKSDYFDESKYKVTSFDKEKEHVLYIWDMALFTSKMQKTSNIEELNNIVKSIKSTKHELIKTISIDPVGSQNEKSITLLTDIDINYLIGKYFPPKATKWV